MNAKDATTHLALVHFPSEILAQIVPSTHVLQLYACGDTLLNYKLSHGGVSRLSIIDHWFNKARMARWPSCFLTPSASRHLASFEFVSHQDRDYASVINAASIGLLPRTLISFKLRVKNVDDCIKHVNWTNLFPELQSLTINNTNPCLLEYPGSLGVDALPPSLTYFNTTCLTNQPKSQQGKFYADFMTTIITMAKSNVLPQGLTSLKFTMPQNYRIIFRMLSDAELIDLIAILPTTLRDLYIPGMEWPIQAFNAQHPIQSLRLYLCQSPQQWPLHMPQQLTALVLRDFEQIADDNLFWSSLPSNLRKLKLYRCAVFHPNAQVVPFTFKLPTSLPATLEELVVDNGDLSQRSSGFVWPSALHTLKIKVYQSIRNVPLPSSLTDLSMTLLDTQTDIQLPDKLQSLQLTVSSLSKHAQVLHCVPLSVTDLALICIGDDDDDAANVTFDWDALDRLTLLESLRLKGRDLATALIQSPMRQFPLSLTVKRIVLESFGLTPSIDIFKKLPSTLRALEACIAAKDAPAMLSHFTQLQQLTITLSFGSSANGVQFSSTTEMRRLYDDGGGSMMHFTDLPKFWKALPHTLRELDLSVAEKSVIVYGPSVAVLPPQLRRIVFQQITAPVNHSYFLPNNDSLLPELEELKCYILGKDVFSAERLPRLKTLVDLCPPYIKT